MRRKITAAIAIFLFITGFILSLFPTVSNRIGTHITKSQINEFDLQVENAVEDETFEEAVENGEVDNEGYPIDKSGNRTSDTPLLFKPDLDRLYQDSITYNENLKENQRSLLVSNSSYTQPALNLSAYGIVNGIYGYISALSINMKLPIYLGANNTTMSYGAAHLTYTSLPLGGESTNCVIAGHTGYIGMIFFDNLRNLKIGDVVALTNYWGTLNYKVVAAEIHKPNETETIFINDERDLLTMFTCITDGNGGFNRYYVVCERCR